MLLQYNTAEVDYKISLCYNIGIGSKSTPQMMLSIQEIKMADLQNWAIAQEINTQHRTVTITMGMLDSFGVMHPEPDWTQQYTQPRWQSISESQFVEEAQMAIQAQIQHWQSQE